MSSQTHYNNQTITQILPQTSKNDSVEQINNKTSLTEKYTMPDRNIFACIPEFQQIFNQSVSLIHSQTIKKIQKWAFNRQKQNYYYFVEPQKFIQFSNNQRLEHFQERHDDNFINLLIRAMERRQNRVIRDIQSSIISIKYNNRVTSNRSQQDTNNIIQNTKYQDKQSHKQAIIKFKQILQKEKAEKKRIQSLKIKEQQNKQLLQAKMIEEDKKKKQQLKKNHSQVIAQKVRKSLQLRSKQKQIRKQRQQQFKYIVKSLNKSLSLHQKMQKSFRERYEKMFDEERKKIQTQKSRLKQNVKLQELNIKEHQQKYLKWRQQTEAIRASRIEQQQRLAEMYREELEKKFGKKYDIQDDEENDTNSQNNISRLKYLSTHNNSYKIMKEEQRKIAQQKRKKMQTYWDSFVKVNLKPKIDKNKQEQLQNLIRNLQNGRKMKKVKKQNGEYCYEQLKSSDPTMKGLEYLDYARQIGRLRKLNRSHQISTLDQQKKSEPSITLSRKSEQKKTIDYLKKMRQFRSSSQGQKYHNKHKLSFLDKSDIPFDQKLQRVERQTFKLEQSTKLSENQLKYGKFKTSDEILSYKEAIDNNHIEILKMKLKLAENKGQ